MWLIDSRTSSIELLLLAFYFFIKMKKEASLLLERWRRTVSFAQEPCYCRQIMKCILFCRGEDHIKTIHQTHSKARALL